MRGMEEEEDGMRRRRWEEEGRMNRRRRWEERKNDGKGKGIEEE